MGIKKVLIVDDDAAFHFLQKMVLNENNIRCQIDSVYDGEEALRYMEECNGSPDLILLDVNMPNWDGLDFLEACRQCGRLPDYVKIFIVSSSQLPQDKTRALSYKFVTGFIEKPLTGQNVADILTHF